MFELPSNEVAANIGLQFDGDRWQYVIASGCKLNDESQYIRRNCYELPFYIRPGQNTLEYRVTPREIHWSYGLHGLNNNFSLTILVFISRVNEYGVREDTTHFINPIEAARSHSNHGAIRVSSRTFYSGSRIIIVPLYKPDSTQNKVTRLFVNLSIFY